MPLFGPIKRTYSKKQNAVTNGGKENDFGENQAPRINIQFNSSFEDSLLWKDSFDRLLDDKNVLREKRVIKKSVNASYNRDSSKEDLPELFVRGKNGKRKTSKIKVPKPPAARKPRKRKKPTHIAIGDAVVSTPVGGKKAKKSDNLVFNLSPIGHSNIRFAEISLNRSNFLSPHLKKIATNNSSRLFFNPKLVKKMGERKIEVNVDHESIKELMKSFVQVAKNSQSVHGKSVIELNHTTDDEILEEVLKRTTPETLIHLALLPQTSVTEVLEQSIRNPSFTHVTQRRGGSGNISSTSTFYGFNESSVSQLPSSPHLQFVTHRRTKSNEKRESILSDFHGFSESELSLKDFTPDSVRDSRNDVTQAINLSKSHIPERISLNYLNKTLQIVEEELDITRQNIFERDTAAKTDDVPIIHIEDSPRCIRNDVTQGVFPENSLLACNETQKIPSDIGTDVSVIPATPVLVTKRRTLRPKPLVPIENLSVIDCTPTEKRATRRLTRRNVLFDRASMQNVAKRKPIERKTVAFDDPNGEKSPSRLRERKTVAFEPPNNFLSVPSSSPSRLRQRKTVAFNKEKSPESRKTVAFDEPMEESQVVELPSLQLAPGKWRKSLAAWKRKTLAMSINATNETTNVTRLSNRTDLSTKKISGMRKSDGRWLSTNVGRMTIREDDEDEEEEEEGIHEEEQKSDQELVLEPTTDETCNLSELSLRDSEAADSDQEQEEKGIFRSNNNESFTRSNSSYIDESRRHRSLYRRQLSTRARKTSVYERTSFLSDVVVASSPPLHFFRASPSDDLLLIRSHVTARDVVLRLCKQSHPLPFDELYSAQTLHCCRKIGEGVYSEVFMYKNQGRTIVLKVIPVEGDQLVNGEPQKRFDEIQSEIVIAKELSDLRTCADDAAYMTDGFVEAVNVRCVKGRYPDHLIDLWELYDENRTSDNDHPELFKDDQLFIVLELANGGQDLEAFQFDNAQQSHSAFLQVAITLAIAEKRLEFEHRDLHWGNVLLSHTEATHVTFKYNGKTIQVPTFGVKATIIDFTLSRMVAKGVRLYNDLAHDDELFSASGDYQFDIYRFMKSRLDNCWERFEPYTNLLWLHYMVDKLINGARYKHSKSKKHRAAIDQLMQLRDELLDYKSAADYVECNN
ncbi:uncharacterized protein LOC134830465 [Culicoides brevitarsis]|uniref:uncharacterized protein LOC134830465 n=1 Tax=Culicoides brevitarsis TaxID=469753 RepID=UPI00307C1D3A